MKIATKIWILASVLITLASLAIKFYFLPHADRFMMLTLQEQMQREMKAFEQIIGVVVTAAGNDKDYVRRALNAINSDRNIPIELRRSDFLNQQFGKRPGKDPRNDFEKRAMLTALPAFRETEQFIEYAYPLKAQGVCQTCHIDSTGKPIPLGTPVGLAIRRVSRSAIDDTQIGYFVTDLFWENLALVSILLLVLLIGVYYWLLRPLRITSGILHSHYLQKEIEHHDEHEIIQQHEQNHDEWYWIQKASDDVQK